jgi:hypothetical protein
LSGKNRIDRNRCLDWARPLRLAAARSGGVRI